MGLRLKPKVGLNVTLMECEGQVDRANPVLLGTRRGTVRRESTEFPKANKIVPCTECCVLGTELIGVYLFFPLML